MVKISSKTRLVLIWLFTYFSFVLITASRQALAVSKSMLLGNAVEGSEARTGGFTPFNASNGSILLGVLDSAYVITYAVFAFMWASSRFSSIGMQVRVLVLAMCGSGFSLIMFGLGGYFGVHDIYFYIISQLVLGFCQSGAWSSALYIYGSVFSIDQSILAFTLWGTNWPVGNFIGRIIASAVLENHAWHATFFVLASTSVALVPLYPVFIVMISDACQEKQSRKSGKVVSETALESGAVEQDAKSKMPSPGRSAAVVDAAPKAGWTADGHGGVDEEKGGATDMVYAFGEGHTDEGLSKGEHAVTLYKGEDVALGSTGMQHLEIAGPSPSSSDSTSAPHSAISGSLILLMTLYCLIFMISEWMTFLMALWLPVYLTEKAGYSDSMAGVWSSAFDIGSVLGMAITVFLNYKYHVPGIICFVLSSVSIVVLYLYSSYGHLLQPGGSFVTLLVIGILVDGPFALVSCAITIEVAEEFGEHGNFAISVMNGCGSMGSLFAGLFTGMVASEFGWGSVMFLLIALTGLELIPLAVISWTEIKHHRNHSQHSKVTTIVA